MPQKREQIKPKEKTPTRYVRRDSKGNFDEVTDKGRSLSADKKRSSAKSVSSGQGDKGEVKKSKPTKNAKSVAKPAKTLGGPKGLVDKVMKALK